MSASLPGDTNIDPPVLVELTYHEALRLSYIMRFRATERPDDLRIANAVDEAIRKTEEEYDG